MLRPACNESKVADLVFMRINALSIHFRPFLESVTRVQLNPLSLMPLGGGMGELPRTSLIGFVLRIAGWRSAVLLAAVVLAGPATFRALAGRRV